MVSRFLHTTNDPQFDVILFDTCSIMTDHAFDLCIRKLLKGSNRALLSVPYSVIEELRYLSKKNNESSLIANRALMGINALISAEYFQTVGEYDHPEIGDFSILKYVIQNSPFKRILVVTQDHGLASDLNSFNLIRSLPINRISVKRIEKDGSLMPISEGKTLSLA